MSKRFVVSMVALIAGLTFSPILRSQNAPPKWNNVPPPKSAYAGKKSAPAPRRDISGIWDAAEADGGRQVSGAVEHPALFPHATAAEVKRLDPTRDYAEEGRPGGTGTVLRLPDTR